MLVRLRVPSRLWLLVCRALQRLQRWARWMLGWEPVLTTGTLHGRHDRWELRMLERWAFRRLVLRALWRLSVRRLVLWALWRLVCQMLWRFLTQDHSRRALARWVLHWVLFRKLVRRVLRQLQMPRRLVCQVLRRLVRWALRMPVLLPLGRRCRTLHDVIHHDQSWRAVPSGIGTRACLNVLARRFRRGLKKIVLDVDRIRIVLGVAAVAVAGPAA